MKKVPLSIAIITKDRPQKLKRCLNSLAQQTIQVPLIVIDNSPKNTAKSVVKEFSRHLSITYKNEKKLGASFARNLALKTCTTNWLGFIDDDCVASPTWTESALSLIRQHPHQTAYIVGTSSCLNPSSLVARFHQQKVNNWLLNNIHSSSSCCSVLDTKNCILNVSLLTKHQIIFDSRFSRFHTAGYEDTDLARQCQRQHLNGISTTTLLLSHEEPQTVSALIKKAKLRGQLECLFDQKWNQPPSLIFKRSLNADGNPIKKGKYLKNQAKYTIKQTVKIILSQNPPAIKIEHWLLFFLHQLHNYSSIQGYKSVYYSLT